MVVPDLEPQAEERPLGKRHRFRRRGVPALLKPRILDAAEPVTNAPFELEIDGAMSRGTTDYDGRIEVSIPCGARLGHLKAAAETQMFEHDLDLGHLLPISDAPGSKRRLLSLGYDPPAPNGKVPRDQAGEAEEEAFAASRRPRTEACARGDLGRRRA